MELHQAVALLQHPAIIKNDKQVWADLGSGEGLFSRALAQLLTEGSTIYAVDQNKSALQRIKQQDQVVIKPTYANFVKDDLAFHNLNGILMANALHFVEDKSTLIKKLAGYCQSEHCFLIVEYDTDTANPWVPYPLSFVSLKQFFRQCGYASVNKIHEVPSLYGRSKIYSAIIKQQ